MAALPSWALARVVVVGMLGLARFMVTRLGTPPLGAPALAGGLFSWDGSWYRLIAHQGYGPRFPESLRFFPLYPLVSRLVGLPFVDTPEIGMLVVTSVSALAFAMVVYRLVMHEKDDPEMAGRAAWMASLAPLAFILVWGYAEAMGMALAAAALLFYRRREWGWAAAAGLLAGLTRPTGVLLVVPAIVEAARGLRRVPAREVVGRGAAVLSPLAGVGAFAAYVGLRYGDAWLPFATQSRSDLRGRTLDPVTRLARLASDVAHGRYVESLRLGWAVVFLVLLFVTLRRWPLSYGLYSAAALLVALTAENLNSFERYGFSAFPLLLAAATLIRRPLIDRYAMALSASTLAAYSLVIFVGLYVP